MRKEKTILLPLDLESLVHKDLYTSEIIPRARDIAGKGRGRLTLFHGTLPDISDTVGGSAPKSFLTGQNQSDVSPWNI